MEKEDFEGLPTWECSVCGGTWRKELGEVCPTCGTPLPWSGEVVEAEEEPKPAPTNVKEAGPPKHMVFDEKSQRYEETERPDVITVDDTPVEAADADTLEAEYTRAELDEIAEKLGLNPKDYRNKELISKAIDAAMEEA